MASSLKEKTSFAIRLIRWQKKHGRNDLPWQSEDAYHVWVSEIMLQQTQVSTVIPYYQRFISAFPSLEVLAAATEEQVLAHWSGLGYYSRGRNLLRAAQIIEKQYGGEFPREYELLLALPGIGRSTAAAISALAYDERHAILDGNVKRVLARYCGISGSPNLRWVETLLWEQANVLLPKRDIARYIQAQMDLGATICTRSKPKCSDCPVCNDCVAFQTGRVNELPTSRIRKAKPERHAAFLLLIHGNDILLEKQPGKGVWGGLWCTPQFDNNEAVLEWCDRQGIAKNNKVQIVRERPSLLNPINRCEALQPFTHTFTHFKLQISPVMLRLSRKPKSLELEGGVWLDMEEALLAGIPAPVRRLLKNIVEASCPPE